MIWFVAVVLLLVAYIFYNQWTWIHSYWEFRGVPGPHPSPLIGNIMQSLIGYKSLGELCVEWSNKHKESPLVGFYSFMTPYVLINRTDYVETVLINNFTHFTDRVKLRINKINGSDHSLHLTDATTWKVLRSKIAPIFTVEKIKAMTPLIRKCSEKVLNHIDENRSRDLSSEELINQYIIDLKAKLVFGMDYDGSSSISKDFFNHTEKMVADSFTNHFNRLVIAYFPKLSDYLHIPSVPNEQVTYFKRVMEQAFRERKSSGTKRNDIVQLLLEIKEKGQIEVENMNDPQNKFLIPPQNVGSVEAADVTEELLINQALAFSNIGFKTLSTAITFTLVEICQNPDVMNTLVNEIDSVMQKHNDLGYEALKDMPYLEMCIKEALRLHPVMPVINRCCTRNYTFDNGIQIIKGTVATIPVLAIHSDPQIYPEPKRFKPERFLTSFAPGTYLGFGDGLRNCIAKNLAMIEMKMFLAQLFYRYNIKLSNRTVLPLKTNKRSFIARPTSPAYLSISTRATK